MAETNMDTYESIDQQAPVSAEVHQLETRKSALETYKTFYSTYAQETYYDELTDRASTQLLLGGRALHFDESNDASTHLIVRQYDDAWARPIRRHVTDYVNKHGVRQRSIDYSIPYDYGTFLVVTTDGNTIDRWHVDEARGIYNGAINSTTDQYQEDREDIYLRLSSMDGQDRRELKFNRATGNGTVTSLDNGRMGWIILSERDTERQHARIFEDAATIGHIATAS